MMVRSRLAAAFIFFACTTPFVGRTNELTLADGGKSEYRIVIATDASPSTQYAARELQAFLKQISGAELPVVTDREAATGHEIAIGSSSRLRTLFQKPGLQPERLRNAPVLEMDSKAQETPIDLPRLGDEGYVIRTLGPHLVIAGGAVRGNLYGVYGLLEDHLGCRWLAPGVSRIPRIARITLGPIDETKIPVLEYREPYTFDCFDGDWCARNRMNSSSARLEARHGGRVRFADGLFVHTFARLVPPEKLFATHPEYFSLVGGKRQNGYAQLCCTNEDVIRICTEEIRAAMRAQPDATVFSVSQNDTDKYCECARCQELARQQGSQAAPVLYLANRVAEAVEKDFPGKAVETLAYQWTRRAPKTMRPRPNVIVRLCSIECCFSHPLATCDSRENQAFRGDLLAWSKVSQRLWIWDYTTDFAHYLMPFPNQRVRRPNIRFFVANHVKGIFEQDTYDTPHSELAALGGYLTAKFLWNPDYDQDRAMNEFLEGYYGNAARPIRRYIDLLHDRVERENIHVHIYDPPTKPYLDYELLRQANGLWEEAEKQAGGDADVLRRVQLSRMSVDYAIVERARAELKSAIAVITGRPQVATLAVERFHPWMKTLETSGLTHLQEGQKLDLNEYRASLAKTLGVTP
ncbi:MAG: DUF4838 domain-containing protein [Thermoguttaceae bacterium]